MSVLTLENLTIDASNSYDPDGAIAFYRFQFDDATETDWVKTPEVVHLYQKERFYNIRLKVMDDAGEESNYWATITVEVVDRLPHIVIEPEIKVKPNTEVTLEGYMSWDLDGHIINYTWEFEDNTTRYGPNATHTFTDPGIYNIFLTILDDDRKTNKSSMRIIVDEPGVSRQRTMLGVITIIITAAIGSSAIWFGWRRGPSRKIFRGGGRGGGRGLTSVEGALIRSSLDSWYASHGDKLPDTKQLRLPAYTEPYIFTLALSELSTDKQPTSNKLSKALETDLTPNASVALALAVADVVPAGAQNNTGPLADSYKYAHKQIVRHDELGAARYYVPRTREQEILAVFVTRKLWRRKTADEKSFNNKFTDFDKDFIRSATDLLSVCWKAAHSFKARTLPEEVKLALSLLLCEKAGKRRYGGAEIRTYDAVEADEELDLIEELLIMFNLTWHVLQFEEYKSRSTESKILSAIYTYEKLGAQRYLGDDTGV
jgi:PKD repeat protein